MLNVQGLETFYGSSQALFGVDLEVKEGEVVALLGRNGMGKTTTIRSIMGLTPPTTGSITFEKQSIFNSASYRIARAGLGLVPEGRHIFPNLSVEENLIATQREGIWTSERIYDMFPALQSRKKNMGNQLSGGEQQMLAIGRALLTNPKLLILDEATEGLAPLLRKDIWQNIRKLKEAGQAILVVDSNLKELLATAERVYVLEKGKIAWSGTAQSLQGDKALQKLYLGV